MVKRQVSEHVAGKDAAREMCIVFVILDLCVGSLDHALLNEL